MEFKCKEFSLNHTLSSMKVGTDAILLSSLAERNHKKHILEIGTGCGIISLAMAQLNKTAKITALEMQESIFGIPSYSNHGVVGQAKRIRCIALLSRQCGGNNAQDRKSVV